MKDLVSIVVPVYNMGNSIEECVKSLIEQDYKEIEIILVDDGSKDDSFIRCKELEKQDSRIITYHTENRGSGPARNYGIEHASGRYIYFPDADDKLEHDAISILVQSMSQDNYDLVVFGYRSIDTKGNIIFEKVYPEMCRQGEKVRENYSDYMGSTRKYGIQGAPWNKFFDLEIIKKNNIEYPPLRRHQDEGFIGRYMCYVNKIHFIPQILYIHYTNDLKKEWDKYPVDYIDAVIGLYKTRKETILTWNEKDVKTKNIIRSEYICNVIKALEMSYSPKMKLNSKKRKEWVLKQVHKAGIDIITVPENLGRYQRIVLSMLQNNKIFYALMIMRIKVEVEKSGIINWLRR